MAAKMKFSLAFLFLCYLVLFSSLTFAKRYEEEQEEEQEQEHEHGGNESPYVFQEEHYDTKIRTQHGRVSFLPKFTERSELLRGIENWRLGFLEANPQTFVMPAHIDADFVAFVYDGEGSVHIVREDKVQNFNIKRGDVFRVEAGSPVYLTNKHENKKLYIVKLLRTISTPGNFEVFHDAGGQNPESIYSAFSWEILEAALKTKRENLERLFGQQKQGEILKASKEQIQALSGKDEAGIWPFGGDSSKGSFNLFNQRPSHSNNFGRLYQVDSGDYRQLEDLDLTVSFANITKGAMSGPYFNSRATKLVLITEGEGEAQMACPHLSSSGRSNPGESSTKYQQVKARLRRGTTLIAPAGHPLVVVASQNSNLQAVCFEVNSKGNIKYHLAGRNNVVRLLQKEARELAFNSQEREIKRVFDNQELEMFFPGPGRRQQQQQQQQEEEGGRGFFSIM